MREALERCEVQTGDRTVPRFGRFLTPANQAGAGPNVGLVIRKRLRIASDMCVAKPLEGGVNPDQHPGMLSGGRPIPEQT